MIMMTTEFKEGDPVKLIGKRGDYVVIRAEPNADGSIVIFGGSTNPNGVRNWRTVMPDRLTLVPTKSKRGR